MKKKIDNFFNHKIRISEIINSNKEVICNGTYNTTSTNVPKINLKATTVKNT